MCKSWDAGGRLWEKVGLETCSAKREGKHAKARNRPCEREGSGRWGKLSEEPEGAKGEAVPGAPTGRSGWDQK